MSSLVSISYQDIEAALDWSSSSGPYENRALISRSTGTVYFQSTYDDFEEEEVPDDIEDQTRYITVPHKNDLDLGRNLVFQFIESEAPELEELVRNAFRHHGAYSKFKTIMERRGLLQKWYEYENAATRSALISWAHENGFVISETQRGDA